MDETSIFSITVALSKNPNYINTLLEKNKSWFNMQKSTQLKKGIQWLRECGLYLFSLGQQWF